MPAFDPERPITSIRERAGITRLELSTRLGVSKARISQLETQGAHVRWDTIRRVADACTVELRLTDERPPAGRVGARCA